MDDPENPRTIGALSRGLTESSSGCINLPAEIAPATDPIIAVERAKLMFGCYRKGDAADPETYAAAIAAVLANYPLETVLRVTNPVHGLPSRSNWLPTVKEVREACDEIEQRKQRFADNATRDLEQLEARRLEDEARKRRPTLPELKAKYGETYGLGPVFDEVEDAAEKRRAIIDRANRWAFEAECKAAGMPANSLISPTLAKLIRAKTA
jgi:hypothetical protein